MARLPRVVVTGIPHHVTQRGNARQIIFDSDTDRLTYLDLLHQYAELHRLSLLGYCLMSNHVHLIAVPHKEQSLAQTLKQTHGRYASYWNARHCSNGHVWQGRFYSCPLDDTHLWSAMRYVELNPVRAGMVERASQWSWSSAAVHSDAGSTDTWLDLKLWRKRWTFAEWAKYLAAAESLEEITAIRQFTHTGRPLGNAAFVAELEQSTLRLLAPRKRGRRQNPVTDPHQQPISFVA